MKHLTVLLILIFFATSCKKDSAISSDLIGTWASTPREWQLPIKDVIGNGRDVRFIETHNKDGRHLTLLMGDSSYRFKVLTVKQSEMDLLYLREKRRIHFERISYPESGF